MKNETEGKCDVGFYHSDYDFLLAFIGIVKLSALRSPVDGIFYYPKPVQERAVQLSLTDKKTIRIRAIVLCPFSHWHCSYCRWSLRVYGAGLRILRQRMPAS